MNTVKEMYDGTIERGLIMADTKEQLACEVGDFASKAAIQPEVKGIRLSRILPNDPCPCGSGLKFKKCCGGVKCTQ